MDRGTRVRGARGVKNALIDNYDLRFEWYPSNSEIFSVNLFYKEFHKVIENFIRQNENSFSIFYVNLDRAIAKGIEINLRKTFNILPLKSTLVINGNTTLMEGNVEFSGDVLYGDKLDSVKKERLIMGLAPKSYNAAIEWNSNFIGLSVNYNQTGRILLQASGGDKTDDEYSATREVVGAQLRFKFLKDKLGIKINGSNLFNEPVIHYNNYRPDDQGVNLDNDLDYNKGDLVTYKGYRGRSYSMSVSYTF